MTAFSPFFLRMIHKIMALLLMVLGSFVLSACLGEGFESATSNSTSEEFPSESNETKDESSTTTTTSSTSTTTESSTTTTTSSTSTTTESSTTTTTSSTSSTTMRPPPQGVWYEQSWPTINGPEYEHTVTPGGGNVSLLTGLNGTPDGFTNAMRVTYLASFASREPTAGITLKMPKADTDKPREAWVEFYSRWSPNFSTSGPYCTGAKDHKFFFIFQNDRENHPFTFRSHIGIFGGSIGQYIDGTGPGYSGADALFNGQWHRIRYHAKIDPLNPEWDIWVNDTKYTWNDTNNDNPTSDDNGNWLAYLVLSRNMNCGVAEDMSVDYGRVRVWISDPGW